jgi:hypothetical protein
VNSGSATAGMNIKLQNAPKLILHDMNRISLSVIVAQRRAQRIFRLEFRWGGCKGRDIIVLYNVLVISVAGSLGVVVTRRRRGRKGWLGGLGGRSAENLLSGVG